MNNDNILLALREALLSDVEDSSYDDTLLNLASMAMIKLSGSFKRCPTSCSITRDTTIDDILDPETGNKEAYKQMLITEVDILFNPSNKTYVDAVSSKVKEIAWLTAALESFEDADSGSM